MTTEDIMKYEKLIYSIIKKFIYHYDFDDLKQVGMIGLIKAYKNYDNNQETKFSTYAYTYIMGEVLKYIREDKNIKISKDIIKLNKSIEKAKEILSQKLMREPSVTELSLFLEIEEELIEEAIKSQELIRSLDYVLNDDGKELNMYDTINYEEKGYKSEILDLKEEINKLENNEKELIKYRYFEDKTQDETSKILGISQVKVSRNETKILQKLKSNLVA